MALIYLLLNLLHIVNTTTIHKYITSEYHKFGGYNVVAQAIVDCKKKFIDVFVSPLGSVNDLKVLHKSRLYKNAQYHSLFASKNSTFQHGFPPYFLSDKVIHSSLGL